MEDIYPKTGPAVGTGVINFYGDGFRDDYNLVSLGCKVGEAMGKGYYVSKNQLKCVIDEMELIPEGD